MSFKEDHPEYKRIEYRVRLTICEQNAYEQIDITTNIGTVYSELSVNVCSLLLTYIPELDMKN